MVLAAENGNDHLIDFLMSSSLADPDPAPIKERIMAYSTPILASIGQKNIRVIEVLLKQKGFNPTRRFQGAAYYELAERRRGPVWQEEVHILKQAYDEYIASSNCRLNQDVQDGLISAVDDANAAADISVQHKARVNSGPCKPVQPGILSPLPVVSRCWWLFLSARLT